MTAKLLLIALDGADARLLDEWSASGELGNLAALRRRGKLTHMGQHYDISDDSLWASFQYGVDSAEHGRYHYLTPLRKGNIGMGVTEEDADNTFWNRLSTQGAEVAVIDIPKCPTPKPLNGIQITDWLVHGRYTRTPRSSPPDLAGELIGMFGPAPASRCGYHQPPLSDNEILDITTTHLSSIEQKRAAGTHYLRQRPWDLFMIGFKEAHCAGHSLWQLSDQRHVEYDQARTERLGDPIRRIFTALDKAVGSLVAEAGDQAEIVVLSNTDMQPNGSAQHLGTGIAARVDAVLAARHGSMLSRLGRMIPGRKGVAGEFCKVVPVNESFIAFHICRQMPGRKEDALNDTESLLCELIDPATGLTAFTGFDRPSTRRQGARASNLPDLLAACRQSTFPEAVQSKRLGRIEASFKRYRPGNHAMGGAVIMTGSHVVDYEIGSMADFAGLAEAVLQAVKLPPAQ